MSTMQSIKTQLQNLLNSVNAKTGKSHTNLTDGVSTLINGYGGGGGYSTRTVTTSDISNGNSVTIPELIGAKYFVLQGNTMRSDSSFDRLMDMGTILQMVYVNGTITFSFLEHQNDKTLTTRCFVSAAGVTFDENTGTIAVDGSKYYLGKLTVDTTAGNTVYTVHRFG